MTRSTAPAIASPFSPAASRARPTISLVPAATDTAGSIRRNIAELVERYGNPNTLIEDAAVEAAEVGRPAFWKRTRYSNATVGLVCSDVNMGMALGEALDRWADPRSVHGTRAAILAELIPLNAAAEDALRAAELCPEPEDQP
jgi:hypothetical protein